MSTATSLLRDVVAQLRIAHHIPGRVRLKLDQELSTAHQQAIGDAQRLLKTLGVLPGIRAVNVNLLARSCTVEYDPGRIPPTAWEHLLRGVDSPQAADLLQALSRLGD